MTIYSINENCPVFENSKSNWIAQGTHIVGDVHISEHVSIWFGAVLRGDNEAIIIGKRTNIQENVVLHTDPGFKLTIAPFCTIGHQATLHGCTIGENTLIGMGATILNGAEIGKNSIVGANSLISEGKTYPDGALILGCPAKFVRELTVDEIENNKRAANVYVKKCALYKNSLQEI